jgi:zinc protease
VVLGQGRGSRLYRGVRETGLVTEIGSSNYTPRDLGIFEVTAVSQPDQTLAALDAITGVVAGLRAVAPSHAEVERARNILEARMIRRFETMEAKASSLAEWQALGDWRLFDAYRERLLDANADDVLRVVHAYLDPADATVLVHRPADSAALAWYPPSPSVATEPLPADVVAANAKPRDVTPSKHHVEDDVHVFEHDGIEIHVLPRPSVPLVSIALSHAGGTTEEPAAMPGITGLALRTSIKGTRSRTAAQLANDAESLGGSVSPSVSSDGFGWTITLPSKHFERGFELLVDAARNPTFPNAEFERERKAVVSELALLRDDMYGYPRRLFFEAAYAGDPYGRSIEDVEAMLDTVTVDVVRDWHRRTAASRSPTVFIAGDVDPGTAARVAAGFIDAAETSGAPVAGNACWPDTRAERIVERKTAQTALVLGFPGPARNHPDVDTFRVLAAAVGGLGGSLFEELRSRRSLAYTVAAQPVAWVRGGAFIAYIATSPEREEEARAGLLDQLLRLREERIDESELVRARNYLIGSRQIRLQTNGARLGEVASAVMLGRGVAELRDHDDRIRGVTADAIRDAAARWMDEGRVVMGAVRGTGKFR